jgi:putative transposase
MSKIENRKLYYLLGFDVKPLKIGRDKIIDVLRTNYLLKLPKRSYHITTNSHQRFRKYKKSVDGFANKQVRTGFGFQTLLISDKEKKTCYLSLIRDAYSKK